MSEPRNYRLVIDSMVVVLFCFLGNWTWHYFLTGAILNPIFPEAWRTPLIYFSFYATVPAILVLLFPNIWLLRLFIFVGSLGLYIASFELDSQSMLFLMPVITWQLLISSKRRMTVGIIRELAFNTSLVLCGLTLYSLIRSLWDGENPLFTFSHALTSKVVLGVTRDPFSLLLSSPLKFLLPVMNTVYLIFFLLLPVLIARRDKSLHVTFLLGALYPLFNVYFLNVNSLEWTVLFLPILLILAFREPKMAS